jgi:hypothetical protein
MVSLAASKSGAKAATTNAATQAETLLIPYVYQKQAARSAKLGRRHVDGGTSTK